LLAAFAFDKSLHATLLHCNEGILPNDTMFSHSLAE